MGWFDEQIKERKERDRETFEETFIGISDAVTGSHVSEALADARGRAKNAIGEILSYYHAKTREIPGQIKDVNEQLEYLMRPHGIMLQTLNDMALGREQNTDDMRFQGELLAEEHVDGEYYMYHLSCALLDGRPFLPQEYQNVDEHYRYIITRGLEAAEIIDKV